MMSLDSMTELLDFIRRQSRRTNLRVVIALPVLLLAFCALMIPYGSHFNSSIPGLSHMLGSQSGSATMHHHENTTSSASAEDYIEVGAWKDLSLGDQRHQHSPLPYTATTTLVLPLSSELLYFLSQGSGNAGAIDINDDGETGSIHVKVDVQMYYNTPEILESSKVCRLRAGPGKNGIGVFTPARSHSEHQVFFSIKVRLPSAEKDSRISISSFETNMPHYRHTVGDLARSFDFGIVSLRSSNEAVTVKSLIAKQADVKTVNDRIQGTFKAPTVGLQTSNALIEADVSLVHERGCKQGILTMRTHNGPITSRISLLSESQGNSGGTFKVSAKTSNDALNISFPTAPLDSVLHVDAQTSNARAAVDLHRTFEGDFHLQTSAGQPSVQQGQSVEDPAGTSRTRTVSFERERRGIVSGKVAWEPQSSRRTVGSVDVKSSNAEVLLTL